MALPNRPRILAGVMRSSLVAIARHWAGILLCLVGAVVPAHGQEPPLLWAADAEGGAPFVEADPSNPDRLVGFDVEIAHLIAAELGREPQFVQVSFTALDQSAIRGDFDIGLGGIEDTPARRASVAVSVPYYRFTEVLTVREEDRDRFRTLADLGGRRVATLGGTIAYEILLQAAQRDGIIPVSYDDDVHPYTDTLNGRVEAVLLDNVLADRAMRRFRGLHTHPAPVAVGHYVVIAHPQRTELRDEVNRILRAAMADGRLEAIFRRWGVWNEQQRTLYAEVLAGADPGAPAPEAAADGSAIAAGAPLLRPMGAWDATARYLPSLLRASGLTLLLSCLAMALAVTLGVLIAAGRVYGNALCRGVLTAYVEVMRGTPVLLQLFVIYYGLSAVVRLPAFVAALIGLGLNYAAYESEIYRSALLAVSKGQLEAARVLGLSEPQIFRLIRGPQALRLALAPMTNDFVALLKDSSLVSVITVVELTKQTQIFATNLGSWVVPGLLCAGLYLAMSLPLAHLARRLEARWSASRA
jgi:polar amino acid transport system substrate-binding protein